MRKIIFTLIKISLAFVLLIAALSAWLNYFNWAAERDAKVFCDGVELGVVVSTVISKFEARGKTGVFHYELSDNSGHSFLFPGVMGLDKAFCDVALAPDGKVVSKTTYMMYD